MQNGTYQRHHFVAITSGSQIYIYINRIHAHFNPCAFATCVKKDQVQEMFMKLVSVNILHEERVCHILHKQQNNIVQVKIARFAYY